MPAAVSASNLAEIAEFVVVGKCKLEPIRPSRAAVANEALFKYALGRVVGASGTAIEKHAVRGRNRRRNREDLLPFIPSVSVTVGVRRGTLGIINDRYALPTLDPQILEHAVCAMRIVNRRVCKKIGVQHEILDAHAIGLAVDLDHRAVIRAYPLQPDART